MLILHEILVLSLVQATKIAHWMISIHTESFTEFHPQSELLDFQDEQSSSISLSVENNYPKSR